ncbi:hypothetical protein BS78_10G127000 [Paspalum vaginatum]|nr:hypothetical protein BS78_10G127000 [Paspalum vaginatum]
MASWVIHLALLLCIPSQQVLGAEHHTISVQSLLSGSICSSSSPAGPATPTSRPGAGRTLHIIRRACQEKTGEHMTASDHYTALLRRDQYRVQSIHRRLAGAKSTSTIPAHLGLPFHTDEYVVTVGVGTPPQNLTVLFDTGSDLTWVQCTPCSDACYPQEEPLFNRSNSKTYRDIPCDSPSCDIGGGQETSCGSSTCAYNVQYGDQSQTWGDLANETVTLSPASPPAANVVFGCSQRTSGFKEIGTKVAGLLGLGRGDSSILSQTGPVSVFSYCLPPRVSSTGYLTIGAAPQGNFTYTPLRTMNPQLSSMYAVDLVGVSVNGAAIPIPAGAFAPGATIIDSGTVLTHMPAEAYGPLRDEFRRHMGRYKMLPPGAVVDFLDTCYDVTGQDVLTVPRVGLEFGSGGAIDVDASGILVVAGAKGEAVACLAFVPIQSAGLVIVGNMQQRAYNVVFDVAGGRVGFGANGCN